MGRRCSVKGCKSKVNLFSAPKISAERKKWSDRLGFIVTETAHVCELHLDSEDVVTEKKVIDSAGNEITVKLMRHSLKPGALPRELECLEPAKKIMKLRDILDKQPPSTAVQESVSIEASVTVEASTSGQALLSVAASTPDDKFSEESDFQDSSLQDLQSSLSLQCAADNVDDSMQCLDESSMDHSTEDLSSSNVNKSDEVVQGLYDVLVNNKEKIKYPNSQWVSNHNIAKEVMIFSLIDAMLSPSGSGNIIPIFKKQVIVHKDSRMQMRFCNKNIHFDLRQGEPKTLQDFESTLRELDTLDTCIGGPSITYFKNIHVDTAYRDCVTWRHNKCPVILSTGKVCQYCSGLYKILSQSHGRQKKEKRRIKITGSEPAKKKLQSISNAKRILKQRLTRKERRLNELTLELNNVHQRIQNIQQNIFDDELKKISMNLTQNQITLINECLAAGKVSNPKSRRYTHEWLLLCMLLHIRSSAAYNMLRDNGILPLPAKSTILKYLRSSNTGCGFDEKFLKLLKKKMETLPSIARNGILSFDKISVRSSLEVNSKTLTFDGLINQGNNQGEAKNINEQADHALVFMFSSLYKKFHQPIAMFGSKGATTSNVLSVLVLQAILEIEKAGGKVHGIVCDGATTNRSMWKSFGISGKIDQCNYKFINPYEEGRYIYAFSDAPHLIKCIRNRLEQKKCLKVNGSFVKWSYYEALYYRDSQSNLRVCPKLTENHVKLVHAMKMRVFLATQLFSNSVADGLQFYAQLEKRDDTKFKLFEGFEATRLFTQQMNNLFDVLNRSHPKEGIRNNSKDFETIREAISWLDRWERQKENDDEFLTSSTAEGLRVTLHSTLHLTTYLLQSCGLQYVLTSKMNQDCLEQFFGIIRQAGCQNNHPTFPTFMQLYHLLSVYKILRPPKYGNCTVREKEEAPKITLEDFQEIFKDNNKSYRKEHIQKLKEKLDGFVDHSEWECDDIIESDYKIDEIKDCIIYYVTGFVARKMHKSSVCETCKTAFTSSYENLIKDYTETELVSVKSRGGLIHPNIHLFKLFQTIEFYFQKNLESANIYNIVIEELLSSDFKFTFPCTEHRYDIISYCIYYYITLRMRQYSRIKNRDLKKISAEKKKMAKLYSQ